MIPWWVAVGIGIIIVLQTVFVLLLYAFGRQQRRAATERDRAGPDELPVVCSACGESFATERLAIEHAKAQHQAPDDQNARYILTERPSQ